MTTVGFPGYARKAWLTSRNFINGNYPEANAMTFLQEEANRIAGLRLKSWSFCSPIASVPAAGGASRQRWRMFIHTSTHCRFMWVRTLAMPSNNTGNPIVTVSFTLAGGGAPSAVAEFQYGASTDSDTPNTVSAGTTLTTNAAQFVELDPDTDYEINVTETTNARALAVCLWENPLEPDTDNGYILNGVSAGTNVYDAHRAGLIPLLRNSYLANGAPLITWSADTDSAEYDAAGEANILDGSTTVTTATAGFTIDCTYRGTVSRAGVPCRMRAYIEKASGTGSVLLKDSSGTTLATATSSGASAAWFDSGVFYLPETLAKYDLYGKVNSGIGNTHVYAVAVYQADDT